MGTTREQQDEDAEAHFARQDDVAERFGGIAQAERDRLREVAMDAAEDEAPPVAEARLFTVHVAYLARLTVACGKSHHRAVRWESGTARLVVQARDEADAVARGTAWFERERAAPTASIAFGNGVRDATDVRLAEGSRLGPAVWASASDDPHVLVIER